jgi:hypothetical protein
MSQQAIQVTWALTATACDNFALPTPNIFASMITEPEARLQQLCSQLMTSATEKNASICNAEKDEMEDSVVLQRTFTPFLKNPDSPSCSLSSAMALPRPRRRLPLGVPIPISPRRAAHTADHSNTSPMWSPVNLPDAERDDREAHSLSLEDGWRN